MMIYSYSPDKNSICLVLLVAGYWPADVHPAVRNRLLTRVAVQQQFGAGGWSTRPHLRGR
jgi:hypothetical protein